MQHLSDENVVTKQPFDIDAVVDRIREAVRPFPKAAMFELAEDGFASPFEQLVACMISIRTRDETSLVVARRLFAVARTPAQVAALPDSTLAEAIAASTFHEAKVRQIKALAQRVLDEFAGELPCDTAVMQGFAGVGPKCAHLAAGIACGQAKISVDVHVHRVTNRWGYVAAPTPERTMGELERVLPERYWVEINRLLVPFGKHVCTGTAPKCSRCPVLAYCRQVGVTSHR